jgi:hypothetical protein
MGVARMTLRGTVIHWPPRVPPDPVGVAHDIAVDADGVLLVRQAVTWLRQFISAAANVIAQPCVVRDIRVQALGSGNRYVHVWDATSPPPTNTPVTDTPMYCGPLTTSGGSPVIDYGPEGRVFAVGCVVTLSSNVSLYAPDLSAFVSTIRWRPA